MLLVRDTTIAVVVILLSSGALVWQVDGGDAADERREYVRGTDGEEDIRGEERVDGNGQEYGNSEEYSETEVSPKSPACVKCYYRLPKPTCPEDRRVATLVAELKVVQADVAFLKTNTNMQVERAVQDEYAGIVKEIRAIKSENSELRAHTKTLMNVVRTSTKRWSGLVKLLSRSFARPPTPSPNTGRRRAGRTGEGTSIPPAKVPKVSTKSVKRTPSGGTTKRKVEGKAPPVVTRSGSPNASGSNCAAGYPRKARRGYVMRGRGRWPGDGFCRAMASAPPRSAKYSFSVLLSNPGDRARAGAMYNYKDGNNYNFFYFRPGENCIQSGYMFKGKMNLSGAKILCPDEFSTPSKGWYTLKGEVDGKTVRISVNGDLVTEVTGGIDGPGNVGMIAANGRPGDLYYKTLEVTGRVRPRTVFSDTTRQNIAYGYRKYQCGNRNLQKKHNYLVLDATTGRWPKDGFCHVVSTRRVSGNYRVKGQLYNYMYASGGVPNRGHPGLLFNAKNANNYDFIYFRPHWSRGCYQTGYVKHGKPVFAGSKTGACAGGTPKGRKWFTVGITVKGRTAAVYVNRAKVAAFRPHYSPGGAYGALAANGYKNTVYFRSLRVSRVKVAKRKTSSHGGTHTKTKSVSQRASFLGAHTSQSGMAPAHTKGAASHSSHTRTSHGSSSSHSSSVRRTHRVVHRASNTRGVVTLHGGSSHHSRSSSSHSRSSSSHSYSHSNSGGGSHQVKVGAVDE